MKQKNGGPTLDGSVTKRSIFELPFIAPYCLTLRVSGEWKTAAASKTSKTLFTAV